MSASPATRRAIAEVDFGDGTNVSFRVGNRSIHQFWHLFSAHFRHVFLAPQRRADSGKVAWTWREAPEKRPVTATELAEVRRRLSEASRSLSGGFGGVDRDDDGAGGASGLEAQVRAAVDEMVGQLLAHRDSVLNGFVCRTDAGLMLHSWGAAVAAQPYFPDAQNGEISGTLFVGTEHPAGVSVVLENTQGVGGARVKSDRDGGFRFPSVAPGNYRIRVADRSDFPAALSVTMERESITGLELHSASDEPLSVAGTVTALADDVVPWYKKRWIPVIGLLLAMGFGGAWWWRSSRSTVATTASSGTSFSWQSAKGQLASGEAKSAGSENGKVGEDRGFSSLSNSVPPPKMLATHPMHASSDTESRLPENGALPFEDSSPSDHNRNQELPRDAANKPIRRNAVPARRSPREIPATSSRNRAGSSPSSEDAGENGPANDESRQSENKSEKSSPLVMGRKQAGSSSASSPSSNPTEDAESRANGNEVPPDSAVASAGPTGGGKSPQSAGVKNFLQAGKSASPQAEAGTPEPTAEARDAAASAEAPGATTRLKPTAGRQRKATANTDESNRASSSSTQPAAAAASDTAQDAVTAIAPAMPGKSSGAAPSKKNAPTPASASPGSAAESNPDNGDSTATPASAASVSLGKQRGKVPANRDNGESPGKSDADDSVSASDEKSDAPVPPPSATAAKNVSAQRQSPGRAAASIPPSMDEASKADSTASPSDETRSSLAQPAIEAESLIDIGTIRASTWKPRMVRDLILPTRPLPAAEEGREEAMREKLRRDRWAEMPGDFRQPAARSGFSLVFASDASEGRSSPRWKNDAGIEPAGASVHDNRADLDWAGAALPAEVNYVLGYPDGRVVAQVSVDRNGVPALKTASGVRAWYWLGIERTAAGDRSGEIKRETNYDWELLKEGAIPRSWKQDDQWLEGRGQRISIPIEPAIRTGSYEIALVDPATGWALVSSVAVSKP